MQLSFGIAKRANFQELHVEAYDNKTIGRDRCGTEADVEQAMLGRLEASRYGLFVCVCMFYSTCCLGTYSLIGGYEPSKVSARGH